MRYIAVLVLFSTNLFAQFAYQPVVAGLGQQCTSFAVLPDGRTLICERLTGNVRVAIGGVLQATPWWSSGITTSNPGTELGLLSVAVDPQFISNSRVYVCYTDPAALVTRIVRLVEAGGIGTSPTTIHTRPCTGNSHHGGPLVFGHDGYLYAQTGDGQQPAQAQNWNDPRGKSLRMDGSGVAPASNPVAGVHTWSKGHRNGYGLAFHPTLGFLYETSNGQAIDELNRIVGGADFEWPALEGPGAYLSNPIYWWPAPAFVPTGIALLTPETKRWNSHRGELFVAQWNGWLHSTVLTVDAKLVASPPVVFWPNQLVYFALSNGPDGNLWVLHEAGFPGSGIWNLGRFVDTTAAMPGAHIGPVSGPSIGGSVTVGLSTAVSNGYMLAWCSTQLYSPPVPSPWGSIEVPADLWLGGAFADVNGNVFHVVTIPNDPLLQGTFIHTQGMDYDLSTGAGTVTNSASHTLR